MQINRGTIFPALAEVEKYLRGGAETGAQREERLKLAEKAKQDYYRLAYHVMPEGGWMNDPNGLIQYRGRYHVFYQHYPYAPEWGPMHWGHVVSDDLVHWEYLPFALWPDQSYEKGCFSGSAVDNQGELTLIYTAHDDTRSPREVQCAAFSNDGVNFTKHEKNPVIPGPPESFGEDFRDPKVFREKDRWFMVVGCTKDRQGGVLLYSSQDLRHWECRGLLCASDGSQGDMWECPDMFKLGDTWVIMTSPINMKNAKTVFITGEMDFDKAVFTQRQCRKADYGVEFYAPQTFEDDKGRRILFSWMHTWGSEIPTSKNGWSGALTFPRELFLKDGEVWQRPVEELKLLRGKALYRGALDLNDGRRNNLVSVKGDCLEIEFQIPRTEQRKGNLTLLLRASENGKEKTALTYDFVSRCFTLDKRQSGDGQPALIQTPPVEGDEPIPVHILVDKSSVEVFLYGGKYAVSNRIFPRPSSVFYDIFVEERDLVLPGFCAWELVP
jgi:beta-fructofuranosidase